MKITDGLLGEHAVLYAWFEVLEEALEAGPETRETRELAHQMTRVLGSHARVENELLLDVAAERGAESGPLAVMRREHDEIEELLEEAGRAAAEAGKAAERATGGAAGEGAGTADAGTDPGVDPGADRGRASELLREVIAVAREHFEKEERAAFPLAERTLGPELLEAQGARWARRRGVRLPE